MADATKAYTYAFSIWPDNGRGFSTETFEAFAFLKSRIEIQFTEDTFRAFRAKLHRDGFILMEIERWPYVPPEPVR